MTLADPWHMNTMGRFFPVVGFTLAWLLLWLRLLHVLPLAKHGLLGSFLMNRCSNLLTELLVGKPPLPRACLSI